MFNNLRKKLIAFFFPSGGKGLSSLAYLDEQDLSRFSEQDIILETDEQIQKLLPDVLGQALARTWIDKRFLEAFYQFPVEVLERGGVYLPDHISVEFKKRRKGRPKVTVYESQNDRTRKLLELKLIMVAEGMILKKNLLYTLNFYLVFLVASRVS